jgi:putative membrane protein
MILHRYRESIMNEQGFRPAWSAGRLRTALFLLFWLAFCLSGIRPSSRIIWIFQSLTPVAGCLILFVVRRRFLPSVPTSCILFVQGLLLLTGAHFSYERIAYFRLTLPDGTERGYVDWFVHIIDGMVFVLLFRDIMSISSIIRANWLFRGTAVLTSLGLAALWELTEWVVGAISGDLFFMLDGLSADSYVDMAMTLAGSLLLVPWLKPIASETV